MASAKYTRIDARKSSSSSSSSCWSTLMIVAFAGVCLVGIWIINSSSPIVVPVDNSDVSSGAIIKNDVSAMAKKYLGGNSNNENTNYNSTNNENENSNSTPPGDNNEDDDPNQFEDDADNLPNKDNATEQEEEEEGANNNQQNSAAEEENPIEEENQKDREPTESDNGTGENTSQQTSEDENKGNDQLIQQPMEEKNDDKLNEAAAGSGDKNDQQLNQAVAASGDKNDQQLNQAAASGDKSDQQLNQAAASVEKNNQQLNQAAAAAAASGEKTDEKLNQAAASGERNDEKLNQGGPGDQNSNEVLYPSGAQSGLLKETTTQNGSFSTQAQESKNEKEAKEEAKKPSGEDNPVYNWKLCKTSAWADYIPCLDNLDAIRQLRVTKHYEHRERHCPANPPTCLVPLPEGYQRSIEWPTSRDKIWYHNVPHTKLVEYKGDQHWVKFSGEYLTFPGGGTQFKSGALHYIDFIQQSVPEIAWGKHTRVILDVGCGVASFGGYLFERDVLTMSVAPKDEHEAQVQFALERGIPAMSAVMGTKRLSFPGNVFDIVHCARCRVPWHVEGGKLLLELNRLLRPGGFFVWSATPVYLKDGEDVQIWEAMQKLTKSMCWELVTVSKNKRDRVGIAFYRKPVNNECYEQRQQNEPPLCSQSDGPNAAWNVSLQACLHKVPVAASERGSQWPEEWPARLDKPPHWLATISQVGVYGNPAAQDFATDIQLWNNVFHQSYLNGIGVNWTSVRNVMDMRAIYGGFAAALRDIKVWVMNIVTIYDPDTLPIIYERGLLGVYHDWCESFNTYPRSYDLLHANHLFSIVKNRCNYMAFIAEVDRILRPQGILIVRDSVEIINELQTILKSMQWEIRMTYSQDKEGLLSAHKTMWRPKELETLTYAMA